MTEQIPAPAHLSEPSRHLWAELVPERVDGAGKLTVLQAALESLDRADQARIALDAAGLTFTTAATGAVHVNPLARIEKDSRAAFLSAWASLHLDREPPFKLPSLR